jgi:hypothetical protein
MVIYLDNGSTKVYNINEIQNIGIIKASNDYVLKVYFNKTETAYYPVNSIDSLNYEKDSNNYDVLSIFTFGSIRKRSLFEVDSICIQKLETKIKGNVIVIDLEKSVQIKSAGVSEIVFFNSSQIARELKVNDIITAEPIEEAPNGFLRRVKSISNSDNEIIVQTENASLTDVVENGIISFKRKFTPADTGKVFIKVKEDMTQSNEGFTIGFKDIEIFSGIKVDGTNTFYPEIGFNLVIENWKVIQCLVQLNVKNSLELTTHANLEYEKEIKKSLNKLLGIPPVQMPSITVMLGWLPVVITSNIDVQVGFNLNIGAEVSSGITLDASAIAGIEYNSGQWKPISELTSSSNFDPPELSLGGSVKAFVGPQLNVNFYGLQDAFNAYVGIYGFLELEVDLLSKPLWQLWSGVEGGAGLESEWFNLEYELPIVLEYRKLLAQANELIESIIPDEGAIGDKVTISGEGFGSVRGTSYVGFKTGNSLIDIIHATQYDKWSDDEIIVTIPNGLSEGNLKIIINVGGLLSNMTDFNIINYMEKKCEKYEVIMISDKYYLNNDKWGSVAEGKEVEQCIFRKVNEFGWLWDFNNIFLEAVNFPCITYGVNPHSGIDRSATLPLELQKIDEILVSYKARSNFYALIYSYNLSFDCWIIEEGTTPVPENIKYEVMVWEDKSLLNMIPLGEKIEQNILGNYDLYQGSHPDGWMVYSFYPKVNAQISNRNLDLYPFFKYLIDNEYIVGNTVLSSISFGNEVLRGAGKTEIEEYSISIHDKSKDCEIDGVTYTNNASELMLHNKNLTYLPDCICRLNGIRKLILSDNQLASLPSCFGNLNLLYHLDIENNSFNDFPISISTLSNLTTLYLDYNSFSELPSSISNLLNLELLSANNCGLEYLPESIGELKKLKNLDLSNNKLTVLPNSICELSQTLIYLFLQGNNFSEEEQNRIKGCLPNTAVYF